ncbi:MAG: hypothetical protein P8N51_13850 [Pseudomonadales bacterium]|nr:hypothetical protein [Pseudomonadales bacterium]MDG1443255.1 hypothetical protein [Pseudomonadales bacterium]
MGRFLKNSQLRLFLSGSFFTAAFVWMAITSYDVDKEEIKVFLILSFILVGILIVCGFVFSFLLSFFRRDKAGMLGRLKSDIDAIETMAPPEKSKDPSN